MTEKHQNFLKHLTNLLSGSKPDSLEPRLASKAGYRGLRSHQLTKIMNAATGNGPNTTVFSNQTLKANKVRRTFAGRTFARTPAAQAGHFLMYQELSDVTTASQRFSVD
jgi:hypothetical protein